MNESCDLVSSINPPPMLLAKYFSLNVIPGSWFRSFSSGLKSVMMKVLLRAGQGWPWQVKSISTEVRGEGVGENLGN